MYQPEKKKSAPKQIKTQAGAVTTQKKEQKGSRFLKPNQTNIFQRKNNEESISVTQRMAERNAILHGSLRQEAIKKSDKSTHFKHMKAGEKFSDGKAFIAKSHKTAIQKTNEQALNRIDKQIAAEEKKKKPDNDKIAQLKKNDTGLPNNLKSGTGAINMDNVNYNAQKVSKTK